MASIGDRGRLAARNARRIRYGLWRLGADSASQGHDEERGLHPQSTSFTRNARPGPKDQILVFPTGAEKSKAMRDLLSYRRQYPEAHPNDSFGCAGPIQGSVTTLAASQSPFQLPSSNHPEAGPRPANTVKMGCKWTTWVPRQSSQKLAPDLS